MASIAVGARLRTVPVETRTVLQVIGSLPPDGAERFLLDLVRHLDGRYRSLVCCLHGGGALAPAFEAAGIRVITLRKRFRWDVSIVGQLAALVRQERPDLVHTHLFTADAWGRATAWLLQVPAVSTAHSSDPWRSALQRRVDGLLSRLTAQVVAVSGDVARSRRQREGVPAAKLTTIANGIDLSRFRPAPDAAATRAALGLPLDRPVVGIIGRLSVPKNHELLVDAAALLRERGWSLSVLIVGDGERRDELAAHVRRRSLGPDVRLLGQRTDIPEILGALDAYVMSSRWEGMPIGLIEAMASACPIVATTVGGIPEMIAHEQTGLLVPPGDPRLLAAAIERLLAEPALARRLGQAARAEAFARYDIRQVARAYETLYDRVLSDSQI